MTHPAPRSPAEIGGSISPADSGLLTVAVGVVTAAVTSCTEEEEEEEDR